MKEFTKADLQVGYIIEDRGGNLKMVMPAVKELVLAYEDGSWGKMANLDDDLTFYRKYDNQFDIMKVYGFSKHPKRTLEFTTCDRELLWERKEMKKQMTVAEIEKELGYGIEIISES